MSHCHASALADPARVLRVGGRRRAQIPARAAHQRYRQGARTDAPIHAGLLAPQGKILFELFVVADGDGDFLIEVAQDKARRADEAARFISPAGAGGDCRKSRRSKVAAAWGGPPRLPEGAIAYADPRLAALGFRAFSSPKRRTLADARLRADASEADYHAMRIRLGVPEGGRDYAFGETFPHEALFDQLNGVDFAKGCYVGQEVVSRMEHRGTARKRIVPVEGDAPLPAPGTRVEADGVPIGTLGSVSGASGLA